MWIGFARAQIFNVTLCSRCSAPEKASFLLITAAQRLLAVLSYGLYPIQAQVPSTSNISFEGRFEKAKSSMTGSAIPGSFFEQTQTK
jgi:hypothetical protein